MATIKAFEMTISGEKRQIDSKRINLLVKGCSFRLDSSAEPSQSKVSKRRKSNNSLSKTQNDEIKAESVVVVDDYETVDKEQKTAEDNTATRSISDTCSEYQSSMDAYNTTQPKLLDSDR